MYRAALHAHAPSLLSPARGLPAALLTRLGPAATRYPTSMPLARRAAADGSARQRPTPNPPLPRKLAPPPTLPRHGLLVMVRQGGRTMGAEGRWGRAAAGNHQPGRPMRGVTSGKKKQSDQSKAPAQRGVRLADKPAPPLSSPRPFPTLRVECLLTCHPFGLFRFLTSKTSVAFPSET